MEHMNDGQQRRDDWRTGGVGVNGGTLYRVAAGSAVAVNS